MADSLAPPPRLVQRALSGHGAIGLLTGALLYLVCLSGTLAVLQEHLQRWEEPRAAEMTAITPEAAQRGLEMLVGRQGKATSHAFIHLPTEGLPRVVVTTDHGAAYIDAAARYSAPEHHRWTEFVLLLHYYLHLPSFWGLLVTGSLGVMLCATVITGVLAHPRIFRDAFRMRLRGRPQLARADIHNRFGVWLMPFFAALGFSGAILGIGELAFQAIAEERHGGNFEASYGPLFGTKPKTDAKAAPMARADKALAWMAAHHPEHRVTYVTIDDPQTAGQEIQILADHEQRLIYGESYMFDGAGRPTGKVGLSDGHVGQQAVASLYKLHFGDFGGVPVELAYVAFGLGLCAVIATGTTLWLGKKRARGYPSTRLEALWAVTVWGSPAVLAYTYWAQLLFGSSAPLGATFWALMFSGWFLAACWPTRFDKRHVRNVLGLSLLATGAMHLLLYRALPLSSLAIDAALLTLGLSMIIAHRVSASDRALRPEKRDLPLGAAG